jgi:seryl-tRNA synthetase
MNFNLKAILTLSKDVGSKKNEIKEFVDLLNNSILSKGAPEGKGAKIIEWNIQKDQLSLTIVSEQFVRAHDAVARIRKAFGERLGKKLAAGVRSIAVPSYEINFELEQEPKNENITIPFADSVKLKGKQCTIILKNVSEEILLENYVDRMIKLVKEKVNAQYYEGKGEHWELLWQSEKKKSVWDKDPSEEMQKLGWIKQGPTKGKWFFNPQAATILRAMENIAVNEVLKPLGFQEVIEPHHVPFEIWLKTGHLEGMPHEIYYVSEPMTRDAKEWERFRDYIKIAKKVPMDELKQLIATPTAGICYAQCPVLYWSLSGETIANDSLPVLIYDKTAISNRYESGGRHGIERVDEFHRIEPVYIGTPEQMLEIKDKLIEKYKHVFNDILELEWRMAWVTPFYMQQAGQVGVDDATSKRVKGTIDFEAHLPYRGDRGKSEWLEFQNLSVVGDKYTKAFNIKSQKGELWSGCSGIGLERWTAAFLAQKGLDIKHWPAEFRERVREIPKGIKVF